MGLADHLNLRAMGHLGEFGVVGTLSDIEYDVDVELQNAGLVLDLYPAALGSFRLSAGIFYNGNDYRGTATPLHDVTIGDVSFTPEQIGTISGRVVADDTAYYAGIGFGNPFSGDGRWTVTLDMGVWFTANSPDLVLTSDGTFASEPLFQNELKKEEEKAEDSLIQWWPVVTLGISYRF